MEKWELNLLEIEINNLEKEFERQIEKQKKEQIEFQQKVHQKGEEAVQAEAEIRKQEGELNKSDGGRDRKKIQKIIKNERKNFNKAIEDRENLIKKQDKSNEKHENEITELKHKIEQIYVDVGELGSPSDIMKAKAYIEDNIRDGFGQVKSNVNKYGQKTSDQIRQTVKTTKQKVPQISKQAGNAAKRLGRGISEQTDIREQGNRIFEYVDRKRDQKEKKSLSQLDALSDHEDEVKKKIDTEKRKQDAEKQYTNILKNRAKLERRIEKLDNRQPTKKTVKDAMQNLNQQVSTSARDTAKRWAGGAKQTGQTVRDASKQATDTAKRLGRRIKGKTYSQMEVATDEEGKRLFVGGYKTTGAKRGAQTVRDAVQNINERVERSISSASRVLSENKTTNLALKGLRNPKKATQRIHDSTTGKMLGIAKTNIKNRQERQRAEKVEKIGNIINRLEGKRLELSELENFPVEEISGSRIPFRGALRRRKLQKTIERKKEEEKKLQQELANKRWDLLPASGKVKVVSQSASEKVKPVIQSASDRVKTVGKKINPIAPIQENRRKKDERIQELREKIIARKKRLNYLKQEKEKQERAKNRPQYEGGIRVQQNEIAEHEEEINNLSKGIGQKTGEKVQNAFSSMNFLARRREQEETRKQEKEELKREVARRKKLLDRHNENIDKAETDSKKRGHLNAFVFGRDTQEKEIAKAQERMDNLRSRGEKIRGSVRNAFTFSNPFTKENRRKGKQKNLNEQLRLKAEAERQIQEENEQNFLGIFGNRIRGKNPHKQRKKAIEKANEWQDKMDPNTRNFGNHHINEDRIKQLLEQNKKEQEYYQKAMGNDPPSTNKQAIERQENLRRKLHLKEQEEEHHQNQLENLENQTRKIREIKEHEQKAKQNVNKGFLGAVGEAWHTSRANRKRNKFNRDQGYNVPKIKDEEELQRQINQHKRRQQLIQNTVAKGGGNNYHQKDRAERMMYESQQKKEQLEKQLRNMQQKREKEEAGPGRFKRGAKFLGKHGWRIGTKPAFDSVYATGQKMKGAYYSGIDKATNLSAYTILFLTIGLLFYNYFIKLTFSITVSIVISISIFVLLVLVLKRQNYRLIATFFALDILLMPQVLTLFGELIPQIGGFVLIDYLFLLAPWAFYVAIIENPRVGFIEKSISLTTAVVMIFFIGNAIGLDIVTASLGEVNTDQLEASLENVPGGNALTSSIGWFKERFNPNLYTFGLKGQSATITTEPTGLIFLDSRLSKTDFFKNEKIVVIKEIEYIGEIEEGEEINLDISCEIEGITGATAKPNKVTLNSFIRTETIICQGDPDPNKKGNLDVTFTATYNDSTILEIYPPIIKSETYLNYLSAGQDPFKALGFETTQIEAYIQNKPLKIEFEVGRQVPIPISTINTQEPTEPETAEAKTPQQRNLRELTTEITHVELNGIEGGTPSEDAPDDGTEPNEGNEPVTGDDSETIPPATTQANQQEIRGYNPIFGLILSKNEQLRGNEREVWQGNMKNIKALIDLPQGLSFQEGDTCDFDKVAANQNDASGSENIRNYCLESGKESNECLRNLYKAATDSSGNIRDLDGKLKEIRFICPLNLQSETQFFGADTITVKPITNKIDYTVEILEKQKIIVYEIEAQ